MKVQVQVKPNSKKEGIELLSDGSYVVRVNVPPVEGKANVRVREILAQHFGVAKSKVSLASGGKSKSKLFDVDME